MIIRRSDVEYHPEIEASERRERGRKKNTLFLLTARSRLICSSGGTSCHRQLGGAMQHGHHKLLWMHMTIIPGEASGHPVLITHPPTFFRPLLPHARRNSTYTHSECHSHSISSGSPRREVPPPITALHTFRQTITHAYHYPPLNLRNIK